VKIAELGISFAMLIYRTSGIPLFLTRLPLIHRRRCVMAPVEEDVAQVKDYAAGRKDAEEPLSPHYFKLAIDLPDLDAIEENMRAGKYKDSATISFDVFGWDAVDVVRILRFDEDEDETERKLRDEDFERDFVRVVDAEHLDRLRIKSLGAPISILPFIDDWERFDSLSQVSDPLLRGSRQIDRKWNLTRQERESIEREERMLFELHRAEQRHRKLRRAVNSSLANGGAVTPRLREQILRLDKYTDFFTGAAAPHVEVDVHHIIPRWIIERLDLPRELLTAPYNLITVDSQLNRVKGAHLLKDDVELYLQRFADPTHRNHPILQYLAKVKELQLTD
jgi:hypothetical protein